MWLARMLSRSQAKEMAPSDQGGAVVASPAGAGASLKRAAELKGPSAKKRRLSPSAAVSSKLADAPSPAAPGAEPWSAPHRGRTCGAQRPPRAAEESRVGGAAAGRGRRLRGDRQEPQLRVALREVLDAELDATCGRALRDLPRLVDQSAGEKSGKEEESKPWLNLSELAKQIRGLAEVRGFVDEQLTSDLGDQLRACERTFQQLRRRSGLAAKSVKDSESGAAAAIGSILSNQGDGKGGGGQGSAPSQGKGGRGSKGAAKGTAATRQGRGAPSRLTTAVGGLLERAAASTAPKSALAPFRSCSPAFRRRR